MRRGCLSIAVGIASGSKSGSQTLATMGKTGHILLITAEFGAAPAAAPGGGGGKGARGQMVPGSFSIVVVGK